MKIGIIIPVFNSEKTITKTIKSILTIKDISKYIVIIDNSSQDSSVKIIEKYIKNNLQNNNKFFLIQNKKNEGYGFSIKKGFDILKNKVNYLTIIHSDYQTNPSELLMNYIKENKKNNYDLILGSRFISIFNLGKYNSVRKYVNLLFNLITSICIQKKISDAGTAMIFIKSKYIYQIEYKILSNSWYFHPQLNILLLKKLNLNYKYIHMKWEDSTIKSSIPLIKYGINLLFFLIMFFIKFNILKSDIYQSIRMKN